MHDRCRGFDMNPADATVGIISPYLDNSQQRRHRFVCLGNRLHFQRMELSNNMTGVELAQERRDGWFEVELGEIHCDGAAGGDDEVEMVLKEVNNNYSKMGLIVQGIELRPKTA